MKKIILFLAFIFFAKLVFSQVSSVTGQYLQDTNLLVNPGFESGVARWNLSSGTIEPVNTRSH